MAKRANSTTVTVSLPNDLHDRLTEVVGPRGLSAFLAEAAERMLNVRLTKLAADEIAAATGGPYTEQELAEADRLLAGWKPDLAEAA
jgi:hypothetical protein